MPFFSKLHITTSMYQPQSMYVLLLSMITPFLLSSNHLPIRTGHFPLWHLSLLLSSYQWVWDLYLSILILKCRFGPSFVELSIVEGIITGIWALAISVTYIFFVLKHTRKLWWNLSKLSEFKTRWTPWQWLHFKIGEAKITREEKKTTNKQTTLTIKNKGPGIFRGGGWSGQRHNLIFYPTVFQNSNRGR